MTNTNQPNRYIIGAGIILIAVISAVGLAGAIDGSKSGEPSTTSRPSTTGDQPAAGGADSFHRTPEGAQFGELGVDQAYILPDASEVRTLVESPDVGLVEVGVQVSRAGGMVEVNPGEFSLVTDDGRIFTASELAVEPTSIAFTINAPIGDHEFKVVWERDNQVRLVLFSELHTEPVSA